MFLLRVVDKRQLVFASGGMQKNCGTRKIEVMLNGLVNLLFATQGNKWKLVAKSLI